MEKKNQCYVVYCQSYPQAFDLKVTKFGKVLMKFVEIGRSTEDRFFNASKLQHQLSFY